MLRGTLSPDRPGRAPCVGPGAATGPGEAAAGAVGRGPGRAPDPADPIHKRNTPSAEEYQAWRDGLPESLADSRTAELLEGVCDVDLDALDVELPRGFGRD